ncbi:MAG: MBL fold metallo-hydrolase [Rhodospirillales bacterium]|nr:MBL fold metallo-hydrolase [Rhodospirillales bacterium]
MKNIIFAALFVCGFFATPAFAASLEVQTVTDGVYAIVGPHEQRNATNLANNATLGFVVTDEGVLLVDPGGSYKGAAAVEAAIRSVTDQPVKIVINTGGQDHRWLGNGYFKERGAHIISSAAAFEDQKTRTNDHFFLLTQLMGKEALEGTQPVHADQTFESALDLTFGGRRFEIRHAGPAHTLGDAYVWMPDARVVFTGDIVFTGRMLGIGPARNTQRWISVFEAVAALDPKYVIPGHGHVTTLAQAKAETYDYLVFLRTEISKILEAGGPIEEAIKIDQSAFRHLAVFDEISKRNAQNVYMQMEFE